MDQNSTPGSITLGEIFQQPALWIDSFRRASERDWQNLRERRGILCGAGTSAYAGLAIQAALPSSRMVATTDILTDPRPLDHAEFLLSIARSGDSPESVGVADLARRNYPRLPQFAITCNASGELANRPDIEVLLLDPRTNDRSLVMTSSFSNLVLAGLTLACKSLLQPHLTAIARRVEDKLPGFNALAQTLAANRPARVVVLASSPLFAWAQESCLKILEMTGGEIVVVPETYLGLRHGPMSFLKDDTLVLCLISNDARRQRYEADLIGELNRKGLGWIVAIVPANFSCEGIGATIAACAPELPDELRTLFEIVFPQLLAYQLSLAYGLNPDNPSPDGIINRVVHGVTLH
jgi:tagatose-6-phosphate ketose/aldose isomerase